MHITVQQCLATNDILLIPCCVHFRHKWQLVSLARERCICQLKPKKEEEEEEVEEEEEEEENKKQKTKTKTKTKTKQQQQQQQKNAGTTKQGTKIPVMYIRKK